MIKKRINHLIETKFSDTNKKLEDLNLNNKSQLFLIIGEFRESIDETSSLYEKEKETLIDALNNFLENQALGLDAWDYKEWTKQQAIIKDCESAWEAVLESYCIEDNNGSV